jgi:nucleoid DNA-binding protein
VLTKKDFLSAYKLSLKTNEINCDDDTSNTYCDSFIELVNEYIKKGCVIRFQGCGAIVVRKKNSRVGFNPKTGEQFIVSERRSCSMIKTVRSSAKGIQQESKITTKKLKTDLGSKIGDSDAAEVLVNTFIRMITSVMKGYVERFTLKSLGSFSLRKTKSENCLSFTPTAEIKEYLKKY